MSVADYIDLLSEKANIIGGSDGGNMHRYQETYMDEKDLAEHSFRERSATSQTLKDFTHDDSE